MNEHVCTQEKEIGKMTSLLERIVKEFYGNGRKGIAQEFPELRTSVENLACIIKKQNDTIEAMRVNVSALAQFQASFKEVQNYREKRVFSNRQLTTIIVSIIAAIAGILIKIL